MSLFNLRIKLHNNNILVLIWEQSAQPYFTLNIFLLLRDTECSQSLSNSATFKRRKGAPPIFFFSLLTPCSYGKEKEANLFVSIEI